MISTNADYAKEALLQGRLQKLDGLSSVEEIRSLLGLLETVTPQEIEESLQDTDTIANNARLLYWHGSILLTGEPPVVEEDTDALPKFSSVRNLTKAVPFLHRAVDLGSLDAALMMFRNCKKIYTTKDEQEAQVLHWAQRCVELGDPEAATIVAGKYLEPRDDFLAPNSSLSLRWLKKAKKAGCSLASIMLKLFRWFEGDSGCQVSGQRAGLLEFAVDYLAQRNREINSRAEKS